MFFLGYHGTTEASAQNVLEFGAQAHRLPPSGQIGRGFYIAKTNGLLPAWGADNATARARNELPGWQKVICWLTGYYGFPFVDDRAKSAILKVYATIPLARCYWTIMNEPDVYLIRAMGGLDRAQLDDGIQWLQMVIPVDQLARLHFARDDGVPEDPTGWGAKDHPDIRPPVGMIGKRRWSH